MDRCFHRIEGGSDKFLHDSWTLPHCLQPDDETCWCCPTILVRCPFCNSKPNDVPAEPDEPWEKVCEECGGYGLLDVTDEIADYPPDEPIIVVHQDI